MKLKLKGKQKQMFEGFPAKVKVVLYGRKDFIEFYKALWAFHNSLYQICTLSAFITEAYVK